MMEKILIIILIPLIFIILHIRKKEKIKTLANKIVENLSEENPVNIATDGLFDFTLNWKGSDNSPPKGPKDGDSFFNVKDNCTYVYHNKKWHILRRTK